MLRYAVSSSAGHTTLKLPISSSQLPRLVERSLQVDPRLAVQESMEMTG